MQSLKSWFIYGFAALIIYSFPSFHAFSQFYNSGQDAASVKWRQIHSEHFHVIYPSHFERQAQYLVRYLEAVYHKCALSLNVYPKKISVILHTGNVVSNAFLGWAPKRLEFMTTPPQDNYAHDWLEQLALHEFRHVVQMSAVNRKFARALYYIFGEQITAGILALYVPFWFIEGDATVTETLLSRSGRGRDPLFEVTLRAQLLEKGSFSYDKAVYGSYRDFVPDHYVLGYHLVALARRDYGPQLWQNALNKVAACPLMITPFNRGLRKISGKSKVELYRQYMVELRQVWQTALNQQKFTPAYQVTPPAKNYTCYQNPVIIGGNRVAAMKSSLTDIPQIVLIDEKGDAKRLCSPGLNSSFSLSAAKNKMVWSELSYDVRWENRNFSVIKCYDVQKKRKRQLTKRSRYFSPALSPDASVVVAVECDEQNHHSLVFLDAQNGKIQRTVKAPDNVQLISPSFSDDGKKVVCVWLDKYGKRLAAVDAKDSIFRFYTAPSFIEIRKPVLSGKWIFYSAAYSGIDNIYALDTGSGNIYRVTSVKFGAYAPCVSGDKKRLYYSDYSSGGNSVVYTDIDTAAWEPLQKVTDNMPKFYEPLLPQETGIVEVTDDSLADFPSRPYRKFGHLLNLHSWGPISVDAENAVIRPGFTLMTQNKLGTLMGTAGYEYYLRTNQGVYFAEVSFRQWFPVFDLRFEYSRNQETEEDELGDRIRFYREQILLKGAIRLPLNLSSGKWQRLLQPRIALNGYKINLSASAPQGWFSGSLLAASYDIYFSNKVLRSRRDIYPRWEQTLHAFYSHTPFDSRFSGEIMAVTSGFNFPGVLKNQVFSTRFSWQKNTHQLFRDYRFIEFPRGYRQINREEVYYMSFNYTLPLAYPDWHAGSVLYIKRFWANVFYDYAQGLQNQKKSYYHSAGLEINSDVHLFRFLAPFTLGGRFSWLMQTRTLVTEFTYSINIEDI